MESGGHIRAANALREIVREAGASLLAPRFEQLRRVVSFSSAVTMSLNLATFSLQRGHDHDLDPSCTTDYLAHYFTLDPYVLDTPCLRRMNCAVRWSDFTSLSNLRRGEFGQFMRQANYHHCLAMVPRLRGLPYGVFSLHRTLAMPDFTHRDLDIFSWYVQHVVAADAEREFLDSLEAGTLPSDWLVVAQDGRIGVASEGALRLLLDLRVRPRLCLPRPGAESRLWRVERELYLVTCTGLSHSNLLCGAALEWFTKDSAVARLSPLIANRASHEPYVAIELSRLHHEDHLGYLAARFRFSPQEQRTAGMVLRNYPMRDIARQLGVGLDTAKKYLALCYQKTGSHSRAEFCASLSADA